MKKLLSLLVFSLVLLAACSGSQDIYELEEAGFMMQVEFNGSAKKLKKVTFTMTEDYTDYYTSKEEYEDAYGLEKEKNEAFFNSLAGVDYTFELTDEYARDQAVVDYSKISKEDLEKLGLYYMVEDDEAFTGENLVEELLYEGFEKVE